MGKILQHILKGVLRIEHTVYVMSGYRLEGKYHEYYYRRMSDHYRAIFERKQKRQRIARLLSENSLSSRQQAYRLAAELNLTISDMLALEGRQSQAKAM